MNKYVAGEWLRLENEDGIQMNASIIHTTQVDGVWYAMTRLETGLTVSYSFTELDRMVVFTW